MAAHMEITENTEKYGKDYIAIKKRLSQTNPSGSFLFREIPHKEYKEFEGDRVFLHTRRKVDMFEVHWDDNNNKINKIYLVK